MLIAVGCTKRSARSIRSLVLLLVAASGLVLAGCAGVVSGTSKTTTGTGGSPDTTPPTVSISSPKASATVSGTVTVSANAADNVGVASVQFQLDGSNLGGLVTAAPYSIPWNTAYASNGSHSLSAIAKDAAGNAATSTAVAVTVSNANPTPDTTPPTVSITGPINGATVSGTVTVSANATDNVGVASVQFQVDGANSGALLTGSPYSISWNTGAASNGSHSLRAIAKDAAGNTGTSPIVSVTVSNTTTNPLSVPTGLTATATSSSQINLSWNASSGSVVGYNVYRGGTKINATGTTSYSDTGLAASTSYSYTVAAYDAKGNVSAQSAVATATTQAPTTNPPSVPTGLTATATSASQINLSWSASTGSVAGYNIYRGGTKINATGTTSYSDTGLAASTSYSYTVAAYNGSGNVSAQSAAATATTQGSSGGGGSGLPTSLGWYQIPNTTVQSVCPPNGFGGSTYGFSDNCHAVIDAWGGGVADTSRNRLMIWGGGHSDYAGNEVYALDLNSLTVSRLNNPALPIATGCVEALSGPSPNSRHTYDDLAYIPGADVMLAVTGSMAPTGCASTATWTLNLGNLTWTQQNPSGTAPSYLGGLAAVSYDPNTKHVFVSSEAYGSFASYDPSTNAYSMLNSHALTDYHETSVIDPSRKLFLMFGAGNAYKIDISGNDPNYTLTNIAATGCGFVSSVYPGVAFDSSQNLVVGWAGGNTVYLYNPTTDSCTSVTYANGPGAQQANGTYKRFSYFPALNVFALVNSGLQNAYALRLTSGGGGGTGGGSGPNISGVVVNSITTTGGTVAWTTDVAATTQVEYGTSTAYGTLTPLNSTLTTTHSQALSGLTAGTLYHYRVRSKNSSGVETISGDFAFATNSIPTNPPPTVTMTAPAAGSTLSGVTTVSASASGSIGIARVQFMVDGVNLGSAVTTSPYQTSWDTTSVANGSHSIAATATDTTGNAATSLPDVVTVSNATSGQTTTYQQRCAAPGVLRCVSLDSQSQLNNSPTMSQNWYPAADGVYRCNIVTSMFPPDGPTGSLNCVVPPVIGANASGNFNDVLGGTFGPPGDPNAANGTTFYVQLRERMDSNFVALHTDGEGFKLFGVHGLNPDSTCQSVGIVLQNEWWRGMPTGFLNCGAQPMEPVNNGPTSAELLEQGDYNCTYGAPGPYILPNCFQFQANQWMTFEIKVIINAWDPSGTLPGNGSNTIQVWGAYEGQPLKKFINLTNFPINFQNSAGDAFSKFILYDYDTNRSTASAYPTANCWYSEVVVSTQPIPAPDGPTVQ